MNQIANAAYRAAFDTGSGSVDFELVIGGQTYTAAEYTDLRLDMQLFSEFAPGNVNIRTLTATVADDTISVGDSVLLYATYTAPGGTAYRMLHSTLVVFRNEKKDGQSSLLCYDRLCLSEYIFKRTPTWTERDMLTVAGEIATDLGVTLTTRATASIQQWTLPDPGGMTAREILEEIAKSSCGNFFVDATGKLDFLRLPGAAPTAVATISNENTELDSAENCAQYDAFVAVILSNDAGSWYSPSGLTNEQWEALIATGRTLNVDVAFGSQEIADYIYTCIANGFRYIPYSLSGNIDPALEIGDIIEVEPFDDGLLYIAAAYSLEAGAGRLFGELKAEGESEIETLQPYQTKVERAVRRETVERKAAIEVTQEGITAEVARATEAEGNLSSLITQTASDITISFTQGIAAAEDAAATALSEYSESVQEYIRFAGALIELGEKNSQFKAILSSTKLAFTGADGQEAAWISNNELHINRAVIEETLSIGNWLHQIESNGSYSIIYV